jgi:uncharacterized protein YndB with AHSA1/START domain
VIELRLSRSLPAPRTRVWEALIDPDQVARWWGPAGFTTSVDELDVRVGGGYRFRMQPPDGEAFHLAGEFLAVEPAARLSYTFRWEPPDPDDQETVATLTLAGDGDSSRIELVLGPFRTEARRELHDAGWSDTLDRLAESLDR